MEKVYTIVVTGLKDAKVKQGDKEDQTAKVEMGKDLTEVALNAGVKDEKGKEVTKGVTLKLDPAKKMSKNGDVKVTITVEDGGSDEQGSS